MGLYLQISIVLFYIPLIAIYIIIKNKNVTVKKLKLLSIKRYSRYLKLFINKEAIICIVIFSIISNSIVLYKNQKYEKLYINVAKINATAIVIGNREEKEYNYTYKIKLIDVYNNKKCNNTNVYLQVSKKSTQCLEYGDKIELTGDFIQPETQRNFGGFSYKEYLKTIKVYGSVKAEKVNLLEKKSGNLVSILASKVSYIIKDKIDGLFSKESKEILTGILLGDTSKIEEEQLENFRISNISHVLAVSGMHVTYMILGINLLLNKKVGKRKTRFIIILFLLFYMFITGFSASIVRAGIMAILLVLSKIIYRKNDTWNSMALSLLLILLYEPYLITNIGLQFSYLGTMGIIIFNKNVFKILKQIKIKNRKLKYKINRKLILAIGKVKEILAVTISAQLAILPITIYHFNLVGIYFLITNLVVSIIIGPIIIFGVIAIFISFIFNPIAKLIVFIVENLIKILIIISNFSELPFSKIYVQTPKIIWILVYFLVIFILNFCYTLYNSKILTITQIRFRNLIALYKVKILKFKKVYFKILIIIIVIIIVKNNFFGDLKIYFIDVGQGDSTFIVTPKNKTILIDGGGSLSKNFDIGKSTLLPYILDRGYSSVDYVFVSHMDEDHVRTDYCL